jgi:glycosyltransferase involved in cell wall biosynthesis
MNATPQVSVVLAVYNGEKYLRLAVESILAQTFTDYEFIIIDDGSTDDTLGILRHYQTQHSQLRIISRDNKGLTATLNEGLAMARGEFLARMDADDIALPVRLEKQVEYLRGHPETVLVGSRVLLIDPEGMAIREQCVEATHEEIDAGHLNNGWPVVHPSVMMRTAAVREVGGYREPYNMLEDLDLFLRLAEVGKLENIPEVLLKYRQHFGSVTHEKAIEQSELREEIYRETRERRGLPEMDSAPPARTEPRRRHQQHSMWAWSALKAGNVQTARKHALATLWRAPFSVNSWRVLACAVRGR